MKKIYKNIITTISLTAILGAYYYFNQPRIEQGSKFLEREHRKEIVEYKALKMLNPLQPDVLSVIYDLNKNDIPDTNALYKIKGYDINNKTYIIEKHAMIVIIDKNEDGKPDYMLVDVDDDGTLETRRDLEKIVK